MIQISIHYNLLKKGYKDRYADFELFKYEKIVLQLMQLLVLRMAVLICLKEIKLQKTINILHFQKIRMKKA